MLIDKYDLEVFTPPCDPGAERYAAKAHLNTDLTELLPYLNASLRGAIYLPSAKALTWKKGGHNIVFHAFEIAVSNVEDRTGAEKELKGLINLVNRTWERRAEIDPDTSTRRRPNLLEVYTLLPKTNCKQCGEATCLAFAVALVQQKHSLEECLPLAEDPNFSEQRGTLESML